MHIISQTTWLETTTTKKTKKLKEIFFKVWLLVWFGKNELNRKYDE